MYTRLKSYVLATRPWSFTMTLISAAIGTVLATINPDFELVLILPLVVGLILTHGATNVLNDYYDTKHGVDTADSPTAQYRRHPLISGDILPRSLKMYAVILYIAAISIAVGLTLYRGFPVLLFVLLGLLVSIFYTADPVSYKHLAMGELAAFLMWGPAMTVGSFFVMAGGWEGVIPVVLVSIPHGLWVGLVLFANNLKDISFDGTVGISTLGTKFGKQRSGKIFIVMIIVNYLVVCVEILFQILPLWSLLVILSLPLTVRLIKQLFQQEEVPADADPKTAQIGTVFGLLLVISLFLEYTLL